MKKNLFFGMLMAATVAFVGCSKEDSPNEAPAQKADTQSYLSVQVVPAHQTRTQSGGYVDGTEPENKVNSVDFYFFKADGSAFLLGTGVVDTNGNDGEVNAGAYQSNRYTVTNPKVTEKTGENIDEIVNAVLVIEHNVGNIPASMVAVLNSTAKYDGKSIAELKAITDLTTHTSNGFVMTNSVYVGADGAVAMETPITTDNIKLTANDAKNNPVEIYVERVAVRVAVKNSITDAGNGSYDVNEEITMQNGDKINAYAKIVAWDINTTADNSHLIKNIDPAWDFAWTWNMPADYRSYWATSLYGDTDATTNVTGGITKNFTWNGIPNSLDAVDYCLENTIEPKFMTATTADGTVYYDRVQSRVNNTKVLVKAQLVDAQDNDLKIANWYGQNYLESDLKAVIANALKTKLLAVTTDADAATYTPIKAEDIALRQGTGLNGEDSYKVYFEFSDAGAAKTWAFINDANAYENYEDVAAAEAALYDTEPAKVWNGMSYYFVNIEHLGATKATADGVANVTEGAAPTAGEYVKGYYGVVRNHAYEVEFTGITGLGTPVYNGGETIPWPVEPDETESFISAKINVLSWHLINQSVTLGE